MESKYCTECGQQNKINARFCKVCGHPFTEMAAPANATVPSADGETSPSLAALAANPSVPGPSPLDGETVAMAPAEPGQPMSDVDSIGSDPVKMAEPTAPNPNTASVPYPTPVSPTGTSQPEQPAYTAPQPQATYQAFRPQSTYAAPQAQPQQQAQTQHASGAFQSEARTFGVWLKTFITHPSEAHGGKPWYPIALMLGTSLISALGMFWIIGHGVTSVLSDIPYSLTGIEDLASDNAPTLFLLLFVVFSAWDYGCLLIVWVMRAIEGTAGRFADLHADVAHRLGPWAMLNLVAWVLSLITLDQYGLIVWLVASVTRLVWLIAFAWGGPVIGRNLDEHWVRFLASMAGLVLAAILFYLLVLIVGSIAMNVVNGYVGSFLY